ncbi:MAG TPA: CDP-alcohol phosphatidyltransferase family protein [Opitutaceae bacterium]|nr:CDP-alcohol phosphatidyltransferase family protein [Opitutaceae bacterium]
MKRHLPNLLSALRLALAPAMVIEAVAGGSRAWFLILFGTALLTDAFDGFLARRLHAVTDLGRRLDSWGDYVMTAAAVAGIWLLWPEVVRREWPWFVTTVVGCFAIVVYGLVRWRRVLGYHTVLAKAMVFVLPLAVVALLAGGPAAPFRVAVVLQVLCGVEEMTIAILLPGYSGEMPSVWHALRRRRAAAAPAVQAGR